jgi:dolichol-phosphate mannosyltransferase
MAAAFAYARSMTPRETSLRIEDIDPKRHDGAPLISVVVPTFNEADNVEALALAIGESLEGIDWEMIVVDDDSPDRTYEVVHRLSKVDPRLRCLRRIGRRGLSSAVIEGALAANGEVIAVLDADFQHDERALPQMYSTLCRENADIVVGTRYAPGGGIEHWDDQRRRLSRLATKAAQLLVRGRTSDPMSGFFMVKRSTLNQAVLNMSQQGYKVLMDIILSSPRNIRIIDLPYIFRDRRSGFSKLSPLVMVEFVFLLTEKFSRGLIPARFLMFSVVGSLGLIIHLSVLYSLKYAGVDFIPAQVSAIFCAMIINYLINNEFTYLDTRLRGVELLSGFLLFAAVCSIGALANVGVASLAIRQTHSWSVSGIAGAVVGAVFNFGAASRVVWGRKRSPAPSTGTQSG